MIETTILRNVEEKGGANGQTDRSRDDNERSRVGSRVWLFGACVLLVFHGILWNQIARLRPLQLPATPADLTNPVYALQWRFLMDARPWIPEGTTYTVAAADEDWEGSLFMLSMAVYPGARGLPTSYFGYRLPDLPREALLVLDEDCRLSGRVGLRVIARLSGGCVERRQ